MGNILLLVAYIYVYIFTIPVINIKRGLRHKKKKSKIFPLHCVEIL